MWLPVRPDTFLAWIPAQMLKPYKKAWQILAKTIRREPIRVNFLEKQPMEKVIHLAMYLKHLEITTTIFFPTPLSLRGNLQKIHEQYIIYLSI